MDKQTPKSWSQVASRGIKPDGCPPSKQVSKPHSESKQIEKFPAFPTSKKFIPQKFQCEFENGNSTIHLDDFGVTIDYKFIEETPTFKPENQCTNLAYKAVNRFHELYDPKQGLGYEVFMKIIEYVTDMFGVQLDDFYAAMDNVKDKKEFDSDYQGGWLGFSGNIVLTSNNKTLKISYDFEIHCYYGDGDCKMKGIWNCNMPLSFSLDGVNISAFTFTCNKIEI